ncbi:MAG: hypothetical protein JWN74_449 [Acidobacteriaceae bacterium]|jgi:hypothetical protein|nr:hypothetical protein [Acidobacteriaceae bacterium]
MTKASVLLFTGQVKLGIPILRARRGAELLRCDGQTLFKALQSIPSAKIVPRPPERVVGSLQ